MIVAVVSVLVVQVTADEVVDVIAVRHRRMATRGRVHVSRRVGSTCVRWRAAAGIRRVDGDLALVDVAIVVVVQVTIVQEVDVTVVLDGDVAAVGPMRVVAVFVQLMRSHEQVWPTRWFASVLE